MKRNSIKQLLAGVATVFCCQLAAAASVDISGIEGVDSGNGGSFVKTSYGVWADNGKISFDESGRYTMQLSDLSFSDSYEHVGAMISTTSESIAKIELIDGEPVNLNPVTFVVDKGEYWLSFFAVTNSDSNLGTFGFDVTAAAVPLPPAALFMGTALLGLASFSRQRKEVSTSV